MTALALRFGPFTAAIDTAIGGLVGGLERLYPARAFVPREGFLDFHIEMARGEGLRRWVRPQVRFLLDGHSPFKPLPADQALPMFEWGLNYVIAGQAHQYLVIHAAAIERGGRVAILPGSPGAGKSTLAAGLTRRGWRLLSDELALIRPADGHVIPLGRPINLKNHSIALLRNFAPDAVFSGAAHDTVKGTVALMRADEASLERMSESAPVGWIVFPRWQEGAPPRLEPWSRAAGLMEVAHNAMNYNLHGAGGFELLARIFAASRCYRFTYARLDDAVAEFGELAAQP